MDVKVIVQQLHNLAADPKNRVTIVKDQGCLPGLSLFLANKDSAIVTLALKTLQLLAEEPKNQLIMYKDPGVVQGIQKVLKNPNCTPEERKVALATFKLIQPKGETQIKGNQATEPIRPTPSDPTQKANTNGESSSAAAAPTRTGAGRGAHSFFKVSSKRAKTVTFQVRGTSDPKQKQSVEDALVKVRGLVSFTFNLEQEYFVVRVAETLETRKLVDAILSTDLTPRLVVKNENGEEEIKDFEASKAEDDDGYLDEDHVETTHEKEFSSKTLARLEERKNNKQGGWFGGVGNYIAKSLYW
ncbi:hypothetical protein SARC_07648 [Sphaeroforma arctica JP610]|uniref:Armadillo repeat-containing protein 1 n=1 Tax=Sphaeroforma arctica JP610 TaxID=667725 RepID=A0A0L0FVK5_9EUKA|nr:hypothetical protein SARC_07648 [Sphaeroforma arctica JP610]KNC79978.1 hypothetical protein SARC_07648 [Sphaeroforma arctica JP610]|eukprot:XP_014153880.1 hypothetical protein SARC_07648 [Sphaeroforma arctica JP610]